jgi:hypothetical protein
VTPDRTRKVGYRPEVALDGWRARVKRLVRLRSDGRAVVELVGGGRATVRLHDDVLTRLVAEAQERKREREEA